MIEGFTCDRCKRPIPRADWSRLVVQCGPLREHQPAADLCRPCAYDLVALMREPPGRPAVAAAVRPRPHGIFIP